MKRTLVLFALIMLVSATFAQMKKDRTSAYNYLNKRDLVKAKDYIDKAIAYPEASSDAKVWLYKGNIYLDIQQQATNLTKIHEGMTKIEVYTVLGEPSKTSKTSAAELLFYINSNAAISIDQSGKVSSIAEMPKTEEGAGLVVPDALNIAYDAYMKAKSIDTKEEFKSDLASKFSIIQGEFFNSGIAFFTQQKFDDAIPFFDKAINLGKENQIIDTLANYGSALCFEKKAAADKAFLDQAIAKYEYLVNIKMKEVSVYTSLANLYKDKGEIDKATEVLEMAKKMFPGNTDLIITEANIFISTNNHAKAVSSLMVAKEKEPKNVSVLYAIGVTYDLLKNDTKLPDEERAKYFDDAVDAYKETLGVDPGYFDAMFNLGAIYFNKGGEVINEANKLPISETVKYDKLLTDGNNFLNLALPYLEKCMLLQPKDKPTLVSLKEIYTRLKMTEKLADINTKLSEL